MRKLSEAMEGTYGQPGSRYHIYEATVSEVRPGRYQLHTREDTGSHQGYPQSDGNAIERTYRAESVDALMRIGCTDHAGTSEMCQAIRAACFEAEDVLEGDK